MNNKISKKLARSILENLYNHFWGPEGSFELREYFLKTIKSKFQVGFGVGDFLYSGNEFFWK